MKSSYSKKKVPVKAKGKKIYKKKYTPRKRAYSVARREYKKLWENSCGKHYVVACTVPFSAAARGACVPTVPAPDSQKHAGRLVTTLTAGTSGQIIIAFAPCLASDKPCMYVIQNTSSLATETNFLSTTSTADTFTYLTGAGSRSMSNLPYTHLQLTPGGGVSAASVNQPEVIGRVVSCGVRARYTGRQDHMSGTMTGYVSPDHCNIENQLISDINTRNQTRRVPVSRSGMEVHASAIMSNELEYANNMRNNSNQSYHFGYWYPYCAYTLEGSLKAGGIIGCIIIEGLQNDSTVEVEMITHCEYIGPKVSGSKNMHDQTALNTGQKATIDNPVIINPK